MIGKLLKYEHSRTWLPLLIIFGASLLVMTLFAGLGQLLSGPDALDDFWVGYAIMAIIGLWAFLFVSQLYLGVDAWLHLFGSRQAILTASLPVTGKALYFAKLLHQVIVSAIALLLAGGASLWFFMSKVMDQKIIEMIQTVQLHWNDPMMPGDPESATFGAMVVFSGLMLVLSIVSIVLTPATYLFFVIAGGNGAIRKLGLAGPLVVFIAYNVVAQVVMTLLAFMPPTFDLYRARLSAASYFGFIGDAAASGAVDNGALIPVLPFIASAVLLVLFIWWSVRTLDKKFELRA